MLQDESLIVAAPWTAEQVHDLNLLQVGLSDSMPVHPHTCPNRGDGAHTTAGGDLGVLIATELGWRCPSCDYQQATVLSCLLEKQESMLSLLGSRGVAAVRGQQLQRARFLAAEYMPLARAGSREALLMAQLLVRFAERIIASATAEAESAALAMWVVYESPSDMDAAFVARLFVGERATDEFVTGDSLESVRSQIVPGLTCLSRMEQDDPCIVEVWL